MQHLRRFFANHDYVESLLTLLVATITSIFYWGATSFEFINFDDPAYVTSNPMVIKGFTWGGVVWAFSTQTMGHWHPLTWMSHMLDVSLFGVQASAHHAVNIVLFGMGVSMLFRIFRALTFNLETAFLASLCFAVHPLRLESVIWISERKDVLSFLFGLVALLNYVQKRPVFMVAIFYILSLLAKPTFVTLPGIFVMIDVYFFKHIKWNFSLRRHAAYFLISLFFCLTVLFSQHQDGALKFVTIFERFGYAIVSFYVFVQKFFWPNESSVFYPREALSLFPVLIQALTLILVSITLFFLRRRLSMMWLGWLMFLLTAFPLSGFVSIGGQQYADRWTLLPHVGLWLVVLSFMYGTDRHFSWVPTIFLGLFFCALAYTTSIRLPHWRNSQTLFREALRVTPDNFMAHTNLGAALAEEQKFDEAFAHYQAAIRLHPTYPEALSNMGSALARRGYYLEAIPYFKKALTERPGFLSARYNLGLALVSSGQLVEGSLEWIAVLVSDPTFVAAERSLQNAWGQLQAQCAALNWPAFQRRVLSLSSRSQYDSKWIKRLTDFPCSTAK